MMLSPASREVVLAFADDELMMGHRHSEWLGVAPFLEEDLAHASIAQDELGHARALYGLITRDVDGLAFARAPGDYRCAWLVELPCTSWEDTLVRHFLYDVAEQIRWQSLLGSSIDGLPELAAKALREEQYHLAHAVALVQRLLVGTDESRRRIVGSLTRLFTMGRGLFEPTAGEGEAVAAGAIEPAAAQEDRWVAAVRGHLDGAAPDAVDWEAPAAGLGGRRGARSEHFAALHANMTAVYALEPGATW
jgi:ring-1,2-phenylacetyl-CoA epoxidase subunit PaaC